MVAQLLAQLGLGPATYTDGVHTVHSPVDGERIAAVTWINAAAVGEHIGRAQRAFEAWRQVPAPRRGELVRLFGDVLRAHKAKSVVLSGVRKRPAAGESLARTHGKATCGVRPTP